MTKCFVCGKEKALPERSLCKLCNHARTKTPKHLREPLPYSPAELRKRKPAISSPLRNKYKPEPEGFTDWNNTAIYC